MIITFVGHSTVKNYNETRRKLALLLEKVVSEYDEDVYCYCGGYGQFDSMCAAICTNLKRSNFKVKVCYITPYITEQHQRKIKEYLQCNMYDEVIYPPLETIPLKFAISKRNEWMVSQADIIIAYVTHTYGGAYTTLRYAERKKKKIINLAT